MADDRDRGPRALALAGNIVALTFLGLLLSRGEILFGHENDGAADAAGVAASVAGSVRGPPGDGVDVSGTDGASGEPAREGRVLLVVIDALRDDTARDAAAMPELAALAGRGTRTTWWVDLLVPATICSLEAIVEGVAPPPVSALRDFGARAATRGGWLQDVAEGGGGVVVAGPDLWTERYGAWIDTAHAEAGMPDEAWDERVAAAGLDALRVRPGPRVVVVHLAQLDAVAHRHGAGGAPWRAAARRVDALLGTLVDAAGPGRSIVVLADHGTTRRGGHAGGEAVVRRAPLVVVPARGRTVPQALEGGEAVRNRGERGEARADGGRVPTTVPSDLVRALLAGPRDAAPVRAGEPDGGSPSSAWLATLALVGGALASLLGLAALARDRVPGFVASAAFWSTAGLALVVSSAAGTALAASTLAGLGGLALARRRDGTLPLALAALAGAALAGLAVAIAVRSADAVSLTLPAALLASSVAGLAGGTLAARVDAPRAAGVALAVAVAIAVHVGGETTSLSSVDVRLAHRVAGLVPGGGGIVLATPVALARLALPLAAVLVGYLRERRRRVGRADRIAPDAAFAGAFGACQLGALLVYASCLTRPVDPAALATGLPLAAAGLGGLLREAVTTCLVFGTLAIGGALRTPRAARPSRGRWPTGERTRSDYTRSDP